MAGFRNPFQPGTPLDAASQWLYNHVTSEAPQDIGRGAIENTFYRLGTKAGVNDGSLDLPFGLALGNSADYWIPRATDWPAARDIVSTVRDAAGRMSSGSPTFEADPESPLYGSPEVGLAQGAHDERAAMDAFTVMSMAPVGVGAARAAGVGREASHKTSGPPVYYRGVLKADQPVDDMLPMWWASDRPDIANTYTGGAYGRPLQDGAAVFPSRVEFDNPLTVDARGAKWTAINRGRAGETVSTDDLAEEAYAKGHDGLIIKNVIDDYLEGGGQPSNVVAALRRGTVHSPITGELLFANDSKAAPLGALPALSEPVDINRLMRLNALLP